MSICYFATCWFEVVLHDLFLQHMPHTLRTVIIIRMYQDKDVFVSMLLKHDRTYWSVHYIDPNYFVEGNRGTYKEKCMFKHVLTFITGTSCTLITNYL